MQHITLNSLPSGLESGFNSAARSMEVHIYSLTNCAKLGDKTFNLDIKYTAQNMLFLQFFLPLWSYKKTYL